MPLHNFHLGEQVIDLASGYRATIEEFAKIPGQVLKSRDGTKSVRLTNSIIFRLSSNVPLWPLQPTRWRYPYEPQPAATRR